MSVKKYCRKSVLSLRVSDTVVSVIENTAAERRITRHKLALQLFLNGFQASGLAPADQPTSPKPEQD